MLPSARSCRLKFAGGLLADANLSEGTHAQGALSQGGCPERGEVPTGVCRRRAVPDLAVEFAVP